MGEAPGCEIVWFVLSDMPDTHDVTFYCWSADLRVHEYLHGNRIALIEQHRMQYHLITIYPIDEIDGRSATIPSISSIYPIDEIDGIVADLATII